MRKKTPPTDVTVANEGSLLLFTPKTDSGRTWLEQNVESEATWYAGSLVVEPRYARELAAGMIADGLRVR